MQQPGAGGSQTPGHRPRTGGGREGGLGFHGSPPFGFTANILATNSSYSPAQYASPTSLQPKIQNKHDPDERFNLIDDPGRQKLVRKLKDKLARLMKASGLTPARDRMPLDGGIRKELPDQKIR
jgi:hypothetical protein